MTEAARVFTARGICAVVATVPGSTRGAAVAAGIGGAAWWVTRHQRSPAVRMWRPGGGERRWADALSVRTTGNGDSASVLLHGITASGDIFGAAWDELTTAGQLVAPDLLGFARSMDEVRTDFSLEAHLGALDGMLAALGLEAASVTVVGHSLGGLLALHWAARCERIEKVVVLCGPLYEDAAEADKRIGAMGWLERLFALESPVTEAMCAWMCRHRSVAQWLAVALEPQWPVAIARRGVQHTWPSYVGAMNGIIRRGGWRPALAALADAGVPVVLADGTRDPVPAQGRSAQLAREYGNVRTVVHPSADHELPITHPFWCVDVVRR